MIETPPASGGRYPLSSTWGLVLLGAALALLLGRFTLLPLELEPSWLSTGIAGLGGGCLVAGYTVLRRSDRPMSWLLGLAGALVAALLVLAGLWMLRPTPLIETALMPFETDAFQMQVPATWGPPDTRTLGGQGRLALKASEQGPILEVSWLNGEMATLDELAGALASALGGLGEVERTSAPPVEGPYGAVLIEAIGVPDRSTSTAVAVLACPSGTRISFSLTARAETAEAAGLLSRVVASVVCAEGGAAPTALRAAWTPPAGFAEVPDSGDTLTYGQETPDGRWQAVGLPPISPDPTLAEKMRTHPELAGAMMASLFPGARPATSPAPTQAFGGSRHFYAFDVVDPDTRETLRMMVTAWPCPAIGGSSLAIYMTDAQGSFAQGVELLAQPRCPTP